MDTIQKRENSSGGNPMNKKNEIIEKLYIDYKKFEEQLNKRNEKAIQRINLFQKESTTYSQDVLISCLVE